MAKKKDDESKERPQPTGSVVAEDSALTDWLNMLWARNEPPTRIELWQSFGKRAIRGEMIHHEDFKPSEKLNIEQVNRLANDIMLAAQNDCEAQPRPTKSSYQLAVIDNNRRAVPLTRRIGPIEPKRAYAISHGQIEDDDEDEDAVINAKSLDLRYVKEGLEQQRWDKQRYDRVMGEMLILQHNIIQNQQSVVDRLFNGTITMFEKMQEAEDRRLDRDVIREKEKFKLQLYRDGLRTARNMLPGLFADKSSGANGNGSDTSRQISDANGNAGGSGSTGGNGSAPKDYGPSAERTQVDNFLSDIEEDEALNVALFGDFEEKDGKLVQVKPGIFTLKQFAVFVGVREGRFPASKLDELMPGSKHANAILPEQIVKAQEAGVTDGIGSAIVELIGLRSRAVGAGSAPPDAETITEE